MTNISTLNDVQKIIVLDYGSQYNQLIARRIREFGVFSELKSHKITADEVRAINPIGIILSGGPNSVYAEDAFGIDEEIFEVTVSMANQHFAFVPNQSSLLELLKNKSF